MALRSLQQADLATLFMFLQAAEKAALVSDLSVGKITLRRFKKGTTFHSQIFSCSALLYLLPEKVVTSHNTAYKC